MENKTNKDLLIRLRSIINDFNKGKEILSQLQEEYDLIVEELKKRLDK
jgi:hypothetical protein